MNSSRPVKVAFASCKPETIAAFVARFAEIAPDLELVVVSEFQPPLGRWVPYRPDRSWSDNVARVRSALRGNSIQYAAIVLQPAAPYRSLRALGLRLGGSRTLVYNTNLDHFSLRPRGLVAAARHLRWRMREVVTYQVHPGGDVYTWLWRLRHPAQIRRPFYFAIAQHAATHRRKPRASHLDLPPATQQPGISVVIPSRNGKQLLARLLPTIDGAHEIIVVDNGSDDGTADWLAAEWPEVRVALNGAPLSFAQAVNLGIGRALYSHVCLLNNDMLPEPGFLGALREAFDKVPNLFCASAQIFFTEGKRREETGKTAFRHLVSDRKTTDFPVRCIEPLPGEDLTWVPYGSGGCSLYDWSKLKALGGIDEIYQPAYVEDLDIGIRAWRQGWPTVFCANARTLHDHRTTTSRYYTEAQLEHVLERNYLLFLARDISDEKTFRPLWSDALVRLNLRAALEHNEIAAEVLSEAAAIIRNSQPVISLENEAEILALGSGDVAVFPGRASRRERTVVVASCYSPYPLSHGGAVRIFNLMRRAAKDDSQVLITFVDDLHTPAPELLDICVEVIQVRRRGSHLRKSDTGRPDVVEDFDSAAFRAALKQTIARWAPQIVQLEFTQMAQYADSCGPQARTILVEHDVTIDLYRQLLSLEENYDTREELKRWSAFEREAWKQVDCVITMSEKDRQSVEGARRVYTLPNGVDLNRFQPAPLNQSEPGRLLFIGSFNHLPNLLALDFFLTKVWPHLADENACLHAIAGSNHKFFFDRWRDRVSFSLNTSRVEIEDFVADVRPAYHRASIVIAPLLASAGTNIKIMEAMAMGKAIVSTPGGVNGLDELTNGRDIVIETDPERFAEAIHALLHSPERTAELGRNARHTAERVYNWDVIANAQKNLYDSLTAVKQQ